MRYRQNTNKDLAQGLESNDKNNKKNRLHNNIASLQNIHPCSGITKLKNGFSIIKAGDLMGQLEIKNYNNCNNQGSNNRSNDPLVSAHPSGHISENLFTPTYVVIHPMKLQNKTSSINCSYD